MVLFAGFRSIALVAVGLLGAAVTAAGGWWLVAHRGLVRWLGVVVAVLAPATLVAAYVSAGLLWVVLCAVALWLLALGAGRSALADVSPGALSVRRAVPPRRPYLIMNPRSGGGKVGTFRLREKAEALGADVALLDPEHPQDVAALAREAIDRGADLVGVAGGDGTQALVAGVAAERGIPFLVIPAGTRNHFALDLGLDRDDPATSLEALTDPVEAHVDLGHIGDRVFVNNASFGAYAAVVQSPAYRDDKLRTVLRTLPDLLSHQNGPRLTATVHGTTVGPAQALLISNNPYVPGDLSGLGRRARMDGGTLGVLVVDVTNAVQAAGILRGRRSSGLVSLDGTEVVVDADAPVVPVGVDGESLTLPTPVHCRTDPGALRVYLPRHRPGRRKAVRMSWAEVRRLALTMGRAAAGAVAGQVDAECARVRTAVDRGGQGE
ncbi:diacylglycerol kinase [Streptomyces sp. WAC06614]|nr:diacylglycerol kinase [Streptomyces sp. WAC06614]